MQTIPWLDTHCYVENFEQILYLHPLKIQKLLYDLIACKQLPTTVYVIESCMLTPAVAQYGAI